MVNLQIHSKWKNSTKEWIHIHEVIVLKYETLSQLYASKKICRTLACETKVWLYEMPDHMTYLNGDKFVGPK